MLQLAFNIAAGNGTLAADVLLVTLPADPKAYSVLRYAVEAHVCLAEGTGLGETSGTVFNSVGTLAADNVTLLSGGRCIASVGVTVNIT